MAGNLGELVQMISGLSQIQDRKRQLDLSAEQLHNQASQFASQDQEGKFTQALKIIAGSSAKSREGLGTLINSLAPQYREAAQAMISGQPIDPAVLHASSITAGDAAMNPALRSQVNQESAVQNATGMNQGQVSQSGLLSTLAQGAQGQLTGRMIQGFAQRAATGQTPLQASQDAYLGSAPGFIGRSARIASGIDQSASSAAQTNLGYAGLTADMSKFAQTFGMERAFKMAEINKMYGITPDQQMKAGEQYTKLLTESHDPKVSGPENYYRFMEMNRLNHMYMLGQPTIPVGDTPASTPHPAGVMQQIFNNTRGFGNSVPAPVAGQLMQTTPTSDGMGGGAYPWPGAHP